MFFVSRLIATAVDEPLHRVEQFQPVFQRRFCHDFPGVKALAAMRKNPLPADVLRVDLDFHAILGDAFPTDFTAIAAMPSSRPMKPISSFVVALMPTRWILICKASAMHNFIALMCG